VSAAEIDILVVDDDDDDSTLTLSALDEMGLGRRTLRAHDGEEALELLFGRDPGLSAPRPRLILLDVDMPGMDGLQVLAALREDPRTRAIPVVMLTASAGEEHVACSYELGANGYIVKPADFQDYTAAVVAAGSYWLAWNRTPLKGVAPGGA
jgi:two-component system response regulator